MYKVIFTAVDAPDVHEVHYFDAPLGEVISTAKSLCLRLYNTTEFITAKISKL